MLIAETRKFAHHRLKLDHASKIIEATLTQIYYFTLNERTTFSNKYAICPEIAAQLQGGKFGKESCI